MTPNDGSLPLSFTLDTSCAITRTVGDALLLHEVLAARCGTLRHRPLRALRADDVPAVSSGQIGAAFFATNALLLRNPAVVNDLDGCALSLPCQAGDELPVGLMVWAVALQDDTVLDVSLAIERELAAVGH